MIRQLSLATWFMSLSAAGTRWTDLLKMLAKLNNGVSYTDKDIEGLTWHEKTKLVQKDPVTLVREPAVGLIMWLRPKGLKVYSYVEKYVECKN